MPTHEVTEEDIDLLKCSCKTEEALVKLIYIKLGIIEKDVAEQRRGKGSRWKALDRPERERILMLLELLGHDVTDLIDLIQE
jgi:hypothetical protein